MLSRQDSFRFYSSSLLIMYDGVKWPHKDDDEKDNDNVENDEENANQTRCSCRHCGGAKTKSSADRMDDSRWEGCRDDRDSGGEDDLGSDHEEEATCCRTRNHPSRQRKSRGFRGKNQESEVTKKVAEDIKAELAAAKKDEVRTRSNMKPAALSEERAFDDEDDEDEVDRTKSDDDVSDFDENVELKLEEEEEEDNSGKEKSSVLLETQEVLGSDHLEELGHDCEVCHDSKVDNLDASDFSSCGDTDDEDYDEDGDFHDKKCCDLPSVKVRMIDFAHATHKGFAEDKTRHVGPDHGYMFGLKNLITLFQEQLGKSYPKLQLRFTSKSQAGTRSDSKTDADFEDGTRPPLPPDPAGAKQSHLPSRTRCHSLKLNRFKVEKLQEPVRSALPAKTIVDGNDARIWPVQDMPKGFTDKDSRAQPLNGGGDDDDDDDGGGLIMSVSCAEEQGRVEK